MSGLEKDQRRILRCIEHYQNRSGRTPSYEEIRVLTGMSSKDHVYRDVKALERMGYLRCEPSISRGITLLRTADGYRITPESVSIPVLQHASRAGPVPLADDSTATSEWIDMARALIPDSEGVFAIRAHGDSMIDALVNDGDTIVMTNQENVQNGELVAVRIKNEPAGSGITLKRYFRQNGHVLLKPENPELKSKKYLADEVQVEGKVLCIIRNIPADRAPKPPRGK